MVVQSNSWRPNTWSSPESAMSGVHADLGQAVSEVLEPFKQPLNELF
jgi:hypothetical protein